MTKSTKNWIKSIGLMIGIISFFAVPIILTKYVWKDTFIVWIVLTVGALFFCMAGAYKTMLDMEDLERKIEERRRIEEMRRNL